MRAIGRAPRTLDPQLRVAYVLEVSVAPPTLPFGTRGWDAQPAWSPDGDRLALVSDWHAYDFVWDIFLVNADGSAFTALTGDIYHIDYLSPSWSPSKDRLAVIIINRVGTNDYITTVGVMNSDGSGWNPPRRR